MVQPQDLSSDESRAAKEPDAALSRASRQSESIPEESPDAGGVSRGREFAADSGAGKPKGP